MRFLRVVPFVLALAAAPALADEPDPHAGHHPAASPPPATAPAQPEAPAHCPMQGAQPGAMEGMPGMTEGASQTAGQGGMMGMQGESGMMHHGAQCPATEPSGSSRTPPAQPSATDAHAGH